jgi:hypothetical protein
MKEQSWWIYQDRKVPDPWAIHLTARKERRRIRADTEIYADWFINPNKRFLISDISIVQSANWVDTVARILATYDHPLNGHDREQLLSELKELKESFLD